MSEIQLQGKKIAVLYGGPGSERKVSLASGAGVAQALRSLGAEVTEVDVTGPDFVVPPGVEIAFNAIHGTFGEDGQIQRILESRGLAYTGFDLARLLEFALLLLAAGLLMVRQGRRRIRRE
jgi:D-alanine-D-alanine ligase